MHLFQASTILILLGFQAAHAASAANRTLTLWAWGDCSGNVAFCHDIAPDTCCHGEYLIAGFTCEDCVKEDIVAGREEQDGTCGEDFVTVTGWVCARSRKRLYGSSWHHGPETEATAKNTPACTRSVRADVMRIGETWFYLEDDTPEDHVKALWDIWGQESSVVIPDILLQYEGEEPWGRGAAGEL
ncbi:hypothetical protein ACSS6W_006577 [Trichoderma asperelloides]|nr:hypothetical protein LI328DRAFT_128144 [Trichoderma asperelloides]